MTEKTLVKPKPGLTVINPVTQKPIPADGEMVVIDTYWRRRRNDGDITIGSDDAATDKPAKASKAKE